MHIAICEDVRSEQIKLYNRLKQTELFSNTNCEFSFFNKGDDLIKDYEEGKRYDLIFLDVDMPGFNGIETGKLINSFANETIIIFFTNYEQYALDAFDCNAFHYLLKNASEEKFNSVICKAIEKHKLYHHYMIIKTKNGTYKLNASDIYYIECVQKHLYFHMKDNYYITTQKLYEVYGLLSSAGFYQVHQGYIVNFDKIKSIKYSEITLDNDKKVAISVRRYSEVVKAYNEYIERYLL